MVKKPKRIFILGQSGAGKAILADALAKALGWKYINADFALEPTIGLHLNEILNKEGEAAFQHCLHKILVHQLSQNNIVVATDDSLVCDLKNRAILAKEFSVYLEVGALVQLERIGHNRPLLPCLDYRAFIATLRGRDRLYAEVASHTLCTNDGAVEEHVASIINAIGNLSSDEG